MKNLRIKNRLNLSDSAIFLVFHWGLKVYNYLYFSIYPFIP